MEKVMESNILGMFPTIRIQMHAILLLLYLPVGILLTGLRICLTLNFLISCQLLRIVLSENSSFFRTLNRIFLLILGIKVEIMDEGSTCATVLVSNQRSYIDGFILSHALIIYTEDHWDLPSVLCKFLRVTPFKISTRAGKTLPIVVFPEGCPNSGSGIMKFKQEYFTDVSAVQVAAIKTSRFIPISISTAQSGPWQDAVWMFFSPWTSYKIHLMKYSIKKDDKSVDEFSASAANEMSNMLGVPLMQITVKDKIEYFKNLERKRMSKTSPRLLEMVKKVQEVVPHVPQNVILQDLTKTNSVDITLTNIFEGVVKFTPVQQTVRKPQVTRTKNREISKKTLTPMEKRKAEFIENARRRYIEKHGPDALS